MDSRVPVQKKPSKMLTRWSAMLSRRRAASPIVIPVASNNPLAAGSIGRAYQAHAATDSGHRRTIRW
jgi:hypothetical protein